MPFITQGKTNWKFLLIVIILAVIVGGGALWYSRRPEKSYQPPEIEKSETADWQTYKNEEYEYEIKYPQDWELTGSGEKINISYPYKVMGIEVKEITLEDFIKEYEKPEVGEKIIKQENYVLDNIKGVKLTATTGLGIDRNYIFVTKNNESYVIDFYDSVPFHLDIISTFKFLEEVKKEEQITFFEVLKLKEEFIEENEKEVAFLQDGDIWILSKDLKKKYNLLNEKEAIIDFAFSPDGKEIYWLNGQEIWKKDLEGKITMLVRASQFNIDEFKKRYEEEDLGSEFFDQLKGGIGKFELSPDGKYIAYEEIEDYSGCCMSPPNIALGSIWIMKNDGTGKVKIESKIEGYYSSFKKWFPDSKKILFSHQGAELNLDLLCTFYEVKVDGESSQQYPLVEAGVEPFFSPDGSTIAHAPQPAFEPLGVFHSDKGLWLANLDGSNARKILDYSEEFKWGGRLSWSEDGSLLAVVTYGVSGSKIYVFNKKGKIVWKNENTANSYSFAVLSSDNKYLAATGAKTILVNLISKEIKEFKLLKIEAPYGVLIEPQFFSKNSRLYYLMDPIDSSKETLLPQLWVIDTNTWKNYKVADNVLQIIRLP